MSALPMGWEKRQQQDQGESPWDVMGPMWSMLEPTFGLPNSGGSVADTIGAGAAGAAGAAGGGSVTPYLVDLFGGMYDEPRREY